MVPGGMFGEFQQHMGARGIGHTMCPRAEQTLMFGSITSYNPAVITRYGSLNPRVNMHKLLMQCGNRYVN